MWVLVWELGAGFGNSVYRVPGAVLFGSVSTSSTSRRGPQQTKRNK